MEAVFNIPLSLVPSLLGIAKEEPVKDIVEDDEAVGFDESVDGEDAAEEDKDRGGREDLRDDEDSPLGLDEELLGLEDGLL